MQPRSATPTDATLPTSAPLRGMHAAHPGGIEPLSAADTTVLHLDDPTHPMVVTGVLTFAAPVDWEALVPCLLDRLLERYPRFRQRVVEPGTGLIPLVAGWREVDVDAGQHLTRVRLPAPGDRAALAELVSELAGAPLDPARPLWHLHLVDGYVEDGVLRSAVVARLHHAIADGIALAEVLLSLTDGFGKAGGGDAGAPTAPALPAGDARGGLLGRAGRLVTAGRRLTGDVVRHPERLLEMPQEALALGSTLVSLLALPADPPTRYRGTLHRRKRAAWSAPAPLSEVKRLARETDSTVNDVLLAVAAGALRRYAQRCGDRPVDVRAAVPVNLRGGAGPVPQELGNQFGVVVVPLPVGIADPVARVHAVRAATAALKGGRQAAVTYGLVHALGALPRPVAEWAVDLVGNKCSVIMTNVPGPRSTLSIAGSPLAGVVFWVPQLAGIGLGLSIFSYAGSVTLGVLSDAAIVAEPAEISDGLTAGLQELASALTIDLTGPTVGDRRPPVSAGAAAVR